MTPDILKVTLEEHTKWWRGEGGKRANLCGANLCGADLSSANLCGADLSDADLSSADLRGANLRGANLSGADLSGANLSGANIRDEITLNRAPVRRAVRNDGYEFYLWDTSAGWFIQAGCRWFDFDAAWAHWSKPREGGDPRGLNPESIDILTMFSLALDREEARAAEGAAS